MSTSPDYIQQFRSVLEAQGLCPVDIVADGNINRCGTVGKEQGKDGAYVLHPDPPVSGWWQNYRTGKSDTWTAVGGEALSPQERESLSLRIEADKQARLAAQEQRYSEAAAKAKAIFRDLTIASEDNPYLKRKGVRPAGDLRLKDSTLVVPLLSRNGNLQSLQFIHKDGTKRFLTGGKTAGGFFPIKGCDGPLYVVEGVATGLSIHEATGGTVLCAFNAGNLKSVSEMARATYPEREIVIAGDNDQKTKGNPGKTKAEEAAKAINGKVVVPDFGAMSEFSDFNDLHVSKGLEEVKRQLRRSGGWPMPVPLDDINLPELDLGRLPGFLATFCGAVSSSLQVPVELALSAALAAVATAVQGKARVLVKTDYSEPLNIYQCCALPPGERKSAVVDICKAPLVHWQAEKRAEMANTIRVAKSERQTMEQAIINMRSRAAREEDPDTLRELSSEIANMERDLPEVPHPPRLLADDVTPEALAAIMEPLGGCISIIEAEGDILDILGGRYSSGKANLGLVLKAYSQEPIHVDRRGRDPIVLESPTLTLAVFPQPKVIADMREQSAFRARGFVARFLFWLPKSLLGSRRVGTSPLSDAIKSEYAGLIRRLLDLPLAMDTEGNDRPHYLKLTQEALNLRYEFESDVEDELGPGGKFEHMTDWAGKLTGQATRLAGLIHCTKHERPHEQPIDAETMGSAIYLATVLTEHVKAALDLMNETPGMDCARAIWIWLERESMKEFTQREALEKVKGRFRTAKEVEGGLEILKDYGLIVEQEKKASRGRPSRVFLVNPLARIK